MSFFALSVSFFGRYLCFCPCKSHVPRIGFQSELFLASSVCLFCVLFLFALLVPVCLFLILQVSLKPYMCILCRLYSGRYATTYRSRAICFNHGCLKRLNLQLLPGQVEGFMCAIKNAPRTLQGSGTECFVSNSQKTSTPAQICFSKPIDPESPARPI